MASSAAHPTRPRKRKARKVDRPGGRKVTTRGGGARTAVADPRLLRTVSLLGGRKALGKVETTKALVGKIRKGIPASALEALARAISTQPTPVTRSELLATLGIAKRTADRKKAEGANLDTGQSDRLVRIARTAARAEEVLGNMTKATGWLSSPNRALAGQKPIEVLDTEIGAGQVDDVLTRIEFGVYG